MSRGKPERHGPTTTTGNDNGDANSSPPWDMPRGRQTILSFDSGHLSTKRALRNPIPRSDPARMGLAEVAAETVSLLPGLLATRPDVGKVGELYGPQDVAHTRSLTSPNLPSTTIVVVDADTIDAALAVDIHTPQSTSSKSAQPVCMLNMANAETAGGGFKHGSKAQEEALCYRTSLIFTLKHRYYPLPDEAVIFSPNVLVFRDSMSNGNKLLDLRVPAELPVLSVISCAAVRKPPLTQDANGTKTYAKARDRELMPKKMRMILRTCMVTGCRRIVMGALGCGVFANPPREVAEMWKEVFEDKEFKGWWEAVVFAVLDGGNDDNLKVFKKVLEGMKV